MTIMFRRIKQKRQVDNIHFRGEGREIRITGYRNIKRAETHALQAGLAVTQFTGGMNTDQQFPVAALLDPFFKPQGGLVGRIGGGRIMSKAQLGFSLGTADSSAQNSGGK